VIARVGGPDELWVVVFRVPPDPVPGAVRMRRILKQLGRYYRVEAVCVRDATPDERARHARRRKKPPEEMT
jgi:hypothetical protein